MGKIVLTTGVFDCGMHVGHFVLLQTCREIAGVDGKVIVGVNSDRSAGIYKRKPILDQYDRLHLMGQLKIANDIILIEQEHDIEVAIKDHNVDFYVKGAEWAGRKVTGEHRCKVIFLNPCVDFSGENKISTSNIIQRIKSNLTPDAPTQESVLESAKKDKLI